MRFILGALALAGMIGGASAQALKPLEAPQPDASAQREAPGDLGMAIMSARVSEVGVLLDGAGASSAARISTGTYRVTFGRNVANCTAAAINNQFFGLTAVTFNQNEFILVYWYRDKTDLLSNTSFSLIVYCHK